jgi:hypothetical protein
LRRATSTSTGSCNSVVDQRLDLVGEGRGEQQVLALLGQQREDALDVADEAHVEHAVGFVQHQRLHGREVERALLHVVEQAAGRGDQDVERAREAVDLRLHAHTAEDHGRLHRRVLAVDAHGFLDLRGELARGREDQHADAAARLGVARGDLVREPLQDGQHESGGLAGAGLRSGEQVAAAEHGGNGVFLDGCGFGIAVFGDGTHDQVAETQ